MKTRRVLSAACLFLLAPLAPWAAEPAPAREARSVEQRLVAQGARYRAALEERQALLERCEHEIAETQRKAGILRDEILILRGAQDAIAQALAAVGDAPTTRAVTAQDPRNAIRTRDGEKRTNPAREKGRTLRREEGEPLILTDPH
jgi:hypothetical protein